MGAAFWEGGFDGGGLVVEGLEELVRRIEIEVWGVPTVELRWWIEVVVITSLGLGNRSLRFWRRYDPGFRVTLAMIRKKYQVHQQLVSLNFLLHLSKDRDVTQIR